MKGSPGLLVPVPMSLLLAQSLRHAFPSYHPAGKCGAQQGIRAGPDAAPDSVASMTGSGMDARTTRAYKMHLDFAGLLEESALGGPPGTAGGRPTTSTMEQSPYGLWGQRTSGSLDQATPDARTLCQSGRETTCC